MTSTASVDVETQWQAHETGREKWREIHINFLDMVGLKLESSGWDRGTDRGDERIHFNIRLVSLWKHLHCHGFLFLMALPDTGVVS